MAWTYGMWSRRGLGQVGFIDRIVSCDAAFKEAVHCFFSGPSTMRMALAGGFSGADGFFLLCWAAGGFAGSS